MINLTISSQDLNKAISVDGQYEPSHCVIAGALSRHMANGERPVVYGASRIKFGDRNYQVVGKKSIERINRCIEHFDAGHFGYVRMMLPIRVSLKQK